jgi:small subunit ribosomal protein S1
MSLSIKQLTEDPWIKAAAKYQVGTKHTGEVKNLTPYGVFVELEDGIGGMVHISDLSWTKRFSHPSEFTKVGEKIDVAVLEVDMENRKLSLGHKQLEENPWDTFENVFPVGSYHEATIVKKDDRGAVVQLPYGLEAYAPTKHIKKEDGSTAKVDETLTFKVIEFNRDDKRIIVSHTRYLEDIRKEADQIVQSEKEKEKEEIRKSIKTTQSKVELSTFGDIEGFSELKEQVAGTVTETAAPEKSETPKVEEAPATETEAKDNLKKIEGIGPKIEELLNAAGVFTYAQLAGTPTDKIKEILNEAGSRYQMHDPTSWPMQARLAADGKWDELNEWQEQAKGGKM